jgi:replicative DNA helicase
MSRHFKTTARVQQLIQKKEDRVSTLELKGTRLSAKEREYIQEERALIDGVNQLIKDAGDINLGKLPPMATDLEDAVLGAIILGSGPTHPTPDGFLVHPALPQVADWLKPEHFYFDRHKLTYQAVLDLHSKGEPVDMRTVIHQLRRNGQIETVGGPAFIVEVTSKVSSAANIVFHARILQEYSMRRALIRLATQMTYSAYDDTVDIFDFIEAVKRETASIEKDHTQKSKQAA